MTTLSKYKPKFDIGHIKYTISGDYTIPGYVKGGQIVLQSAYPNLFNIIKAIPDREQTWSRVSTISASNIVYLNNLYIHTQLPTGNYATSTDGITWTTRSTGISLSPNFAYGNGKYVAIFGTSPFAGDNAVLTSTDAIAWTTATTINTLIYAPITFGNGAFVMGTAGGVIRTSTDAITWTDRVSGSTTYITDVVYGGGVFVYGDNSGKIATSTDAITWTQTNTVAGGTSNLSYANGRFFSNNNSYVYTSTDGFVWQQASMPTSTTGLPGINSSSNIAYGNGLYYSPQFFSSDGIKWKSTYSTTTSGTVIFQNGFFLLANSNGINRNSLVSYNTSSEFLLPEARDIVTKDQITSNQEIFFKYE